jgi:hypothetical protein
MLADEVERASSVYSLAAAFAEQIRLARASELAFNDRLLAAEALLCPQGIMPKGCEELDLLARILVRQRRYSEAYRAWVKAFKTTGEKERLRLCLRVLRDYVKRREARLRAAWNLGFVLWLLLLLWLVAYFIWKSLV